MMETHDSSKKIGSQAENVSNDKTQIIAVLDQENGSSQNVVPTPKTDLQSLPERSHATIQKSGSWTTIPSVTSLTSQSLSRPIATVVRTSSQDSNLIARLSSPVLTNPTSGAVTVVPDAGHNYAMTVTTSASPSGSTIHHLGQNVQRHMPLLTNRKSPVLSGGTAGQSILTSSIGESSIITNAAFSRSSNNTSPISSPKSKRIKLDDRLSPEDLTMLRKTILEYKLKNFLKNKENYKEHACELFFLQHGGNMMDYVNWKRRPTPQLISFLQENKIDSDEDDDEQFIHPEVKVPATGGTPVAVSTTLPAAVTLLSQGTSPIPGRPVGGRHGMVFGHHQPTTNQSLQPLFPGGTPLVPDSTMTNSSIPSQASRLIDSSLNDKILSSTPKSSLKSPKILSSGGNSPATQFSSIKNAGKQQSISTVYDSSIGSQEQIVERAKQEAYVMQRISELRKDGLWSSKRLPKVQEPPRTKAHWDYLLEEMVWLANDFAQERKWKKAAAKKCARMAFKHIQEQKLKEEKAEKEEALKLKRIAGYIAKEIKQFWSNIEKVAEYKQQSILDEKRKKALDIHLNFIVDQTEKYSSWLTQGLSQNLAASKESSVITSNSQTASSCNVMSDDEFNPVSETDDEETLLEAENSIDMNEQNEEINMLKKESELPIEDILENLPQEILDEPAPIVSSDCENVSLSGKEDSDAQSFHDALQEQPEKDDNEYKVGLDVTDDEETIDEEENKDKEADHVRELNELEEEGNIPLDELYKKYAGAYDSDFEMPASEDNLDSDDDSEIENASEGSGDESDQEEESKLEETSVECLVHSETTESGKPTETKESDEGPSKEISDIAATAESFQPKGYTLSTAQVFTKVPFLLKHQLREYQHIGLDWLVAMNDKKLNGILADEMGLGKTIQTIALLAHLACEKGVWGPHLIVVPTSVMLNWEMELKKWCPAFKILTYYGSVKERKKKREGWTKPNTFHVCITSYKLVVQDHQSFRRKKWKYLILDEAQNIKNFKSQRWQYLLNLVTTGRLLLTGTPLQNSLMELWSLMHFLMPNVFSSHKEFRDWFSNPMSGMIEGSHEYNDGLIKRLHKVLRPFLLRRLKSQVEKQLPSKYEHVVICKLSKRQRFLYDDFMSRTKTKETLNSGNFLSVINVLMQLRKVCNHPNMFEVRPIHSPFNMDGLTYTTASIVLRALEYDPLKHINFWTLNLLLTNLELTLTAFAAHRIRKFQRSQKLIEEIDMQPDPPPKCPPGKIRLHIRSTQPNSNAGRLSPHPSSIQPQKLQSSSPLTMKSLSSNIIPNQTNIRNVISQAASMTTTPMTLNSSSGPITVQIQQTQQGPRLTLPAGQITQLPGFAQLVQTSSGQHILLTTSATAAQLLQQAQAQVQQVPSSQAPSSVSVNHSSADSTSNSSVSTSNTVKLTTSTSVSKPIGKVAPFNVVSTANEISSKPSSPFPSVPNPAKELVKKSELDPDFKTLFDTVELEKNRKIIRKERLSMLGRINKRRCEACPLYGSDLIHAVNIQDDTNPILLPSAVSFQTARQWKGMGYIHCLNAPKSVSDTRRYGNYTHTLNDIVNTPEDLLLKLSDVIERFTFYVAPARTPSIQLHVSHPPPSLLWNWKQTIKKLEENLIPKASYLHPITSLMNTQFPDRRLLQYDCGKLQVLDRLLRQLKSGSHRVLIFTQMTRMLDILEAFLNLHGHIYLRLDGSTRVEQRQALMERFNADKRIFVFILSTRSGGIGVNLTGADSVIFYDSDWNPTMDAQAQDRCHRIGQTRDVHIYRLISEKTIEENILKKANQKRLLGNIAIEGGNFTTAFFKENALKDLFGEKAKAIKKEALGDLSDAQQCSQMQLEQALCQAEEDSDVKAAKTAKAEAAAELAEFDESIPFDGDLKTEEPSQVEEELSQLMHQLKPVERYALTFLESTQENLSDDVLKQAEEEIEAQKNNWELGRLQALKEEEERRAELEEESLPYYTYSREEAQTQIYISKSTEEEMPMWCPPTPPQDDNDLYIDYSIAFMYENSVMSEIDLPPVYVKRDFRKIRIDPVGLARRQKPRKEEAIHVPRSLFDRPTAALLKMRREAKLQKVKGVFKPYSIKPPSLMSSKAVPEPINDEPEWLIHEDWALLQTIQALQELPLTLTVLSPAQTPNWDLVADIVNSIGRIFRSPKQCKVRYENALVPREEGRVLFDPNSKKQKTKSKSIYKTKNNRQMKTCQLFVHDKNSQYSSLYHMRYETIKTLTNKRTPPLKPLLSNPAIKNPKHAAVLADIGITYEQPLSPVKVAAIRAERIAREKQKSQQAAAAAAEQQVATPRRQTILQSSIPKTIAATVTASPSIVSSKTTTIVSPASVATVVSNTSAATTMVSVSPSYASTVKGIVTQTTALSPVTPVRTVVSSTASIQDQVVHTVRAITNAANSLTSSGSAQSATVVSVANLTPVQVQAAAQRISANLNVIATTSVVGQTSNALATTTAKTLTPAQLQLFRQTALLRHQRIQEQQIKQQQQLKRLQVTQVQQSGNTVQPTRISVAVTSPITTTTGTVQVQVAAQIAQQRIAQQMVAAKQQQIVGMAGKQTITRTMTEAEMTQLLKRQQLQQKAGTIVPVTLSTAQLLAAQAQLQQTNSSTNLQQTPAVATLVKTVSAPGGLGSGSSVTIPVSAVNVGSVSINVSLPQVKVAGSTGKVTTVTQQQQLRQLQIQQQLIQQQRKFQLQQQQQKVVSSLAQVTKMAGKTGIPTQLGTVQIVQGQPSSLTAGSQVVSASQSGVVKQVPTTTVTVQQIQQVIKQVQQQHQQSPSAQASSANFVNASSQITTPTIAVVSSSHLPQVMQQTILAKPISQTSSANIQNVVPVVTTGATQLQARVIPSISSSGVGKQTIQLLTGVHALRPQNASVMTPKIITTQAIGTPTALVKTIPSILQSVATTTAMPKLSESTSKSTPEATSSVMIADTSILHGSNVSPAISASQGDSNLSSSSAISVSNSSATIDTIAVANTAADKSTVVVVKDAGEADAGNSMGEVSMEVDDSMDESLDDANKDSNLPRSSPYPKRVRNPPKL